MTSLSWNAKSRGKVPRILKSKRRVCALWSRNLIVMHNATHRVPHYLVDLHEDDSFAHGFSTCIVSLQLKNISLRQTTNAICSSITLKELYTLLKILQLNHKM